MMRLRLAHKMLFLVGSLLVVELLFVASLAWITNEAQKEAIRAAHFRSIAEKTNNVITDFYEVVSSMVTYHTDRSKENNDHYQRLVDNLPLKIVELKVLVGDDAYQSQTLEKIMPNLKGVLDFVKSFKDMMDRGEILNAYRSIQNWSDEIRGPFRDLITDLHALAQYQTKLSRSDAEIGYRNLFQQTLLALVAANVFLAIWVAYLVARGLTKRIDIMVDNTVRLAVGEQLRQPLGGSDELAVLDKCFHTMAKNLEEANLKERAILDNALDVICSIDSHGVFQKVNVASLRVWGYAADELVGSRLVQLILPEDAERTMDFFKQAQTAGADHVFENRVVRKNGTSCHILWSLHWVPGERKMFCVAHDITERKLVEEMKQEFFAMVSHDLRTPLASVVGSLALLSSGALGKLPEAGQPFVERSEAELSRLIQLINELLDFARMETGKLELKFAPSAVSKILERSIQAVEGLARGKEMDIIVPTTNTEIIVDEERIIQVMVNLLSNAIKFSPIGSSITLGVKEAGDYTELCVSDAGPGIPEESREHIFERFKQLKSGSESRGFGLGLSICKAIIEGHGGSIGVVDNVDRTGSTFFFRIPSRHN